MIVSDRTGIPMDLIDVIHGDTDQVARGGLTVGFRSVQVGGSAIAAATTPFFGLGGIYLVSLLVYLGAIFSRVWQEERGA